jgi:hypothetical protein
VRVPLQTTGTRVSRGFLATRADNSVVSSVSLQPNVLGNTPTLPSTTGLLLGSL